MRRTRLGHPLLGISFLVHGAVQFDERGVLMSFEEDAQQLAQDVASLGFDLHLTKPVDAGHSMRCCARSPSARPGRSDQRLTEPSRSTLIPVACGLFWSLPCPAIR